jgi:hypothetical protein
MSSYCYEWICLTLRTAVTEQMAARLPDTTISSVSIVVPVQQKLH